MPRAEGPEPEEEVRSFRLAGGKKTSWGPAAVLAALILIAAFWFLGSYHIVVGQERVSCPSPVGKGAERKVLPYAPRASARRPSAPRPPTA